MLTRAPRVSPPSAGRTSSDPTTRGTSRTGPWEMPVRRRSLRSVPPARYSAGTGWVVTLIWSGSRECGQDPVRPDGQVIETDPDGIAHGVGHGGGDRDGGDLTEPDAAAGDVLEALGVEMQVDLRDVGDPRDPVVVQSGGEHE